MINHKEKNVIQIKDFFLKFNSIQLIYYNLLVIIYLLRLKYKIYLNIFNNKEVKYLAKSNFSNRVQNISNNVLN